MFEKLFSRAHTVLAYRMAPLVEQRLRYLHHCQSNGFKFGALRKIASVQIHLINFLDLQSGNKFTVTQIEDAAQQWVDSNRLRQNHSDSPAGKKRFVGTAIRFLSFSGQFKQSQPEKIKFEKVEQYFTCMRNERGWSNYTIDSNRKVINRFFRWLQSRGTDLCEISIADTDHYLISLQKIGNRKRSTIRNYGETLRLFIRFAENRNWCASGISESILPPRFIPEQSIPKGIKREQAVKLLAAKVDYQPAQRRAHAILHLLITYGLRSGEVRGLRLNDINWGERTLRVRRPKPGRVHFYPLSKVVGQAIADYLENDRPACEHQELFLTLRAPARPINHSTVYGIVSRRMERIGITGQRKGSHALRHCVAQHLLDQNLSMKTVSDYLGHRSITTTSIYAKINLNSLREVGNVDLGDLL